MYPVYEQAVTSIIVPELYRFYYFLWEYNF